MSETKQPSDATSPTPITPEGTSIPPSLPPTEVVPPPAPIGTGKGKEEQKLDEEIKEKHNPVIILYGKKYDVDSVVVGLVLVTIWVLIWRTSGLSKTLLVNPKGKFDLTFTLIFILFNIYVILNIWSAGTTSGGVVYELNILLTVEQMISILFGTMVLFAIFGSKIPVHANCQKIIFKLTISIIILLTVASLWVNVWTSGRGFRALRKFKQGVYNIALAVFIIIGFIYVKGQCPAPPS
jgi:hypothetical protein